MLDSISYLKQFILSGMFGNKINQIIGFLQYEQLSEKTYKSSVVQSLFSSKKYNQLMSTNRTNIPLPSDFTFKSKTILLNLTQSQMQNIVSTAKFHIKTFHSNRCYIFFQLLQLALSLAIIIRALISKTYFRSKDVMIMEYILLTMMLLDMLIRITGLGFKGAMKSKGNIIDLVILVVFTVTLICLTVIEKETSETEQYQKILETDDIIIITLVMARYTIQIIRTICTIRNTQKNIEINNKIREMDLNASPGMNHTTVMEDSLRVDEAVKEKIIRIKSLKNQGCQMQEIREAAHGEFMFSDRSPTIYLE